MSGQMAGSRWQVAEAWTVAAPVSELDVLEQALQDLRSGQTAPLITAQDLEDLGEPEPIGFDESRHPYRY